MRYLQKYFGFSRRELNGICVLLFIVIAVWCVPFLLDFVHIPEPDYYEDIAEKDDIVETEQSKEMISYFNFDPNKLDAEEWKSLGLSSSQIKVISNYKAKGGVFRRKADLKKIYTLSETDYAKLEPYIHIAEKEVESNRAFSEGNMSLQRPEKKDVIKASKKLTILDINNADTLDLIQLPGIGPVYAKRILKYRSLLGGYCKLEQLLEVYGMDSLRFETIKPLLHVNGKDVIRMTVNKFDYQDLIKHPYISNNHAKVIVQYRKQHGAFKNIEDLANIVLFDKDYLRKIEPYLNFDND